MLMAREILFRGRPEGSSEWIYGDLLQYAGMAQIWEQTDVGKWNSIVDPETVGQYTGLDDENGRKIFEGDIFQASDGDHIQTYIIVWDEDALGWSAEYVEDPDGTLPLSEFRSEGIEIIGNIFDDPELIGGQVRRWQEKRS